MKKIVWLLSAAVIALGMVSCGNKNKSTDPEVKGTDFVLRVSDITATSANVTVLPADTNATYYIGIEPSANLSADVLNIDSLADMADWYINFTISYGEMYGEKYTYDDFLYQGKIEGKDGAVDELLPETEYILYAFKMNNKGQASGELAYVAFKTKEAVPEKTETLKLDKAILYDATAYGYWELLAAPKDSSIILYLSPEEAEAVAGEYSTADLNYYSRVYLEYEEMGMSIIKADVSVATQGKKANITGMIIASNMTQYNLDITANIEEETYDYDDWDGYFAPARKALLGVYRQNTATTRTRHGIGSVSKRYQYGLKTSLNQHQ